MIEKGEIEGADDDFVRFFGGDDKHEPFRLWESHFTTPNPALEFNRIFGFEHQFIKLRAGSYIQFSGSWSNKPQILNGADILHELDTTGKAFPTLNIYASSATVTNGLDSKLFKKLTINSADISFIKCNKPSELYDITLVSTLSFIFLLY